LSARAVLKETSIFDRAGVWARRRIGVNFAGWFRSPSRWGENLGEPQNSFSDKFYSSRI
jgi:hypothetical protein